MASLLAYFAFAISTITYVSPTLQSGITTASNWTFVNFTSDEDLNQSLLEWGNQSGFTNVTIVNSSLINWYVNMTGLLDYAYNYTVWAQNTTGDWNQSIMRFVTVDTTPPYIAFVAPTPADGNITASNWTYINTTISDASNTTAFIDWNRSLVGWWRFNRESGENATLAEPEIKITAKQKIAELKMRISPKDVKAKEKLDEAEAAYSRGDYSRAYELALEAERLIGMDDAQGADETEKKPIVLYYIFALAVLALIGTYMYKCAQKRGFPKREETKESVKPRDKSLPIKERTALNPAKQVPKPNKDADLDDIQRRLERIRKKIGK